MRLAQRLYEGIDIGGETVGLITYMRTDGIDMAPEAIAGIRQMIGKNYGAQLRPRERRAPTRTIEERAGSARSGAPDRSQSLAGGSRQIGRPRSGPPLRADLEPRRGEPDAIGRARAHHRRHRRARPAPATLELRATGQVVKFDGFLTLYQEGQDEPDEDEESRRLPAMSAGEVLEKQAINSSQHFTEPPPRYSEAALVKRMEELGIGRPSTYASILQVLQDRGYVRIDKKRLMPEDKGRVVVGFLESFFQRYVEYDFTANLEEQLDRISNNEIDWKKVLQDFWVDFIGAVNDIKDLRVTAGARRAQRSAWRRTSSRRAPTAATARNARTAKPAELSLEARPLRRLHRLLELSGLQLHPADDAGRQWRLNGTKVLGEDPATGLEVTLRSGRFGPYLQLGEQAKVEKGKSDKPRSPNAPACRRAWRPTTSISRRRWRCLALPREVGISRKTASRSSPASAASGLTSSTARPTPTSKTATTCSPSASTAPSR